ncbi:MAG: helix-turn-helix transcriptional regulator [Flavobacteriaceae bacterium]|nr:helix-turn-helix transcriptional regulator [Flavobacteriaceae bacterium]
MGEGPLANDTMELSLNFTLWNLLIGIFLIVGSTFGLLLFFTKRKNKAANKFMAFVVMAISLWLVWVFLSDIGLLEYYPRITWFPITTYLLCIGPALYFYVVKLIDPSFGFQPKHYLHFSPILLELAFHIVQVLESNSTGKPIHQTQAFIMIGPFFQLLAILSIAVYVRLSILKIKDFTQLLAENYSNSDKYKLVWLKRLILFFGLMWILWLPYTFVDFFFFDYELDFRQYYPLYLLMGVVALLMGIEVFLRPEYVLLEMKPNTEKKAIDGLDQKVDWLKTEIERNLYYLNPELTLNSLAEQLELHPNLLSRIINEGSGKNFSDFINEYRVGTVIEKINNKAYDHITLVGIAHESGFNSKTSFYRTFKKFTDKTPSEYLKQKG